MDIILWPPEQESQTHFQVSHGKSVEDIASGSVLLQILRCSTKELESSLELGGSWPLAIVCRIGDRIHKEFTQTETASGREGGSMSVDVCMHKNARGKQRDH
ncbi:hypothetical protein MHYP_G00267420 [Metynnis hypsauchen]